MHEVEHVPKSLQVYMTWDIGSSSCDLIQAKCCLYFGFYRDKIGSGVIVTEHGNREYFTHSLENLSYST